ncbi:MAG: hypothetical protein KJZ54_13975 [Phycisphaerales bacterium]|nr:hypothetical protein [Phycisphaerales bacterium]
MTVREAKAGAHLDAAGKALRNRLRAHARQLGDKRSAKGEQATDRLEREIAYEHWHRMLFARFLAENDLLIQPGGTVSVSLEEVEELAQADGVKPWPLAASYAQRMLPQIFRADDPVLAIDLPTEAVLKLESLLEHLPREVFISDDALGWTYQFWQAAEKDAVNARVKSGEKITGETLPAVTQLFTEHYMVLFLLHNTIGAWHAGKTLTDAQREGAGSEQALRDSVRLAPLGAYDFEYLRFVREPNEGEAPDEGTGPWRPAAGSYDGWPRSAAELRVLDPCCGSGHFLVAAFDLLVRLRIAEEGLDTEDAIRAVLADNLFGLELDQRCTQIAAFNLALAAWKVAGKPIDLPRLNIACSGLGPQATKEEWLAMAEGAGEDVWAGISTTNREFIRNGLLDLHATFSQAPELGSVIDPADRTTDLITADYETLRPFLDRILAAESDDDEAHERAVAASGMAAAAEILVGGEQGYTLVITNVPYLGRGSQGDLLKAFAETSYKEAKADLATIFVARMLRWVGDGRNGTPTGTLAAVTPQNWLFLTSYKKLRERLLKERSWEIVARLGPGAFETIGGHVVNVALLGITGAKAVKEHTLAGLDVSAAGAPANKATLLRGESVVVNPRADDDARLDGSVRMVPQVEQLKNPDSVVNLEHAPQVSLLSDYGPGLQGMISGDNARFRRRFWELRDLAPTWDLLQTTPDGRDMFRGRDEVIRWEGGKGDMAQPGIGRMQGFKAWGRDGIAVNRVGRLFVSIYTGGIFDDATAVIPVSPPGVLPAIWEYCSSGEYEEAVRALNTKLSVANATLVKVPFDLQRWQDVAAEKHPTGLPEPQSDDPTQWLFHGRPKRAEAHATLQVAVARLLGYRWPAELDEDMRLSPEARELVSNCDELLDLADDDGIVCLSPVRGEGSAADRLRRLLAAAYGSDWSNAKERELLHAAAEAFNKGRAAGSLDEWLRERFFAEHCALFHHRPFVWHIWDGRKDGFHALVNYHKLAEAEGRGRKLLESLTYSYLGDWIKRQEAGVKSGEAGAEARLAAAMELKEQLEQILAGEPPHDIFVRWKPLHQQPIGWSPDINDGVRLNIRPFMSATLSKGRTGAGVLRWKPNIKWTKDRGQEPQKLRPREDFPWFWGWDEKKAEHAIDFGSGLKDTASAGREFDGNRWNDLHYTNAAKQAARERAAEEASP